MDQLIDATPITVGRRLIQPVVRVRSRRLRADDAQFVGVFGRVTPHALHVTEEGREMTLSLSDPQQEGVRGLLIGAFAVSGICLVIMVATKWLTRLTGPRGL